MNRTGGWTPCRWATAGQRISGLLKPRRAYLLYMEVRISISTRWPLGSRWQGESDAGELGSYLLECGAPQDQNHHTPAGTTPIRTLGGCWSSRVGWLQTLIWHQITFRGQPLWGTVPDCWYSTALFRICYYADRRLVDCKLAKDAFKR